MTFIQPNKRKSMLNAVMVILIVALGASIFTMIGLYNTTVNLSHNMDTAKAELDAIGVQNTALNNQIIATLSDGAVSTAAMNDGLVKDERPQYFAIHQ